MQIVKYKELAKEAFKTIKDYQSGSKKVVKLGVPYFDDLFPVTNGSVITFSASSGVGKSFMLGLFKSNILDVSINPQADNYVLLDISLEMRVMSLILRDLSKSLNKSKKDILLNRYSEEELKEVSKIYEKIINDDRVYYSQESISPVTFYEACDRFLAEHIDKDTVVISLDHIALVGSDKGDSRNSAIEKMNERINDLKMKYKNVIFIILSQMNSDSNKRIAERNIQSHPRDTDLYYSNFTFQISDYVAVMVSPYRMGISEYSKLYTERYPNLKECFLLEDDKGRASLKTSGVNYVHLLKCREAEQPYIDIYPHIFNRDVFEKENDNMQQAMQAIPTFNSLITPPTEEDDIFG
jgi:replicative DNA helicase